MTFELPKRLNRQPMPDSMVLAALTATNCKRRSLACPRGRAVRRRGHRFVRLHQLRPGTRTVALIVACAGVILEDPGSRTELTAHPCPRRGTGRYLEARRAAALVRKPERRMAGEISCMEPSTGSINCLVSQVVADQVRPRCRIGDPLVSCFDPVFVSTHHGKGHEQI
jgi:hypothetical protein